MDTVTVAGILGRHADAFACPQCLQPLTVSERAVDCGQCGESYLDADGYPDFTLAGTSPLRAGLAPLRMQDPPIASRYETHSRPSFLQIMGGNWDGALTHAAEREYLRSRLDKVTGPIADVACGAGTWTRVICDAVGTGEVIALDVSRTHLQQCRAANPGIVAVRGSALTLPLRSGYFGAVTIWNALQQLPSPGQVIAAASRCLRPGGVLVLLTYRPATDPLERYFQARHEAAFSVSSFPEHQMRGWLSRAGLTATHIGGPATFLLVTACKQAARTQAATEQGETQ